jgi:hypothetical protein
LFCLAAPAQALSSGQATKLTAAVGFPVRVLVTDNYKQAARLIVAARPSAAAGAKFNGLGMLDALAQQRHPQAGSLAVPGVRPLCVIVIPPRLDDQVSEGLRKGGLSERRSAEFVTQHELWHCVENSYSAWSPASKSTVLHSRKWQVPASALERTLYREVGADLFALLTTADQGGAAKAILQALREHRVPPNGYDGSCLKDLSAKVLPRGTAATRVGRVLALRARLPSCWRLSGTGRR